MDLLYSNYLMKLIVMLGSLVPSHEIYAIAQILDRGGSLHDEYFSDMQQSGPNISITQDRVGSCCGPG